MSPVSRPSYWTLATALSSPSPLQPLFKASLGRALIQVGDPKNASMRSSGCRSGTFWFFQWYKINNSIHIQYFDQLIDSYFCCLWRRTNCFTKKNEVETRRQLNGCCQNAPFVFSYGFIWSFWSWNSKSATTITKTSWVPGPIPKIDDYQKQI